MKSTKKRLKFDTDWLRRHPPKKTITYYGKVRVGRNDKCVCGSGLKFKHCCWNKHIAELIKLSAAESPIQKDYVKRELTYCNKKYRRLTDENKEKVGKIITES